MDFESIEKNRQYYSNPYIKTRITEFLGGSTLDEASCVYISKSDQSLYNNFEVHQPRELPYYLDQGTDVGRSLWDRKYLIAHLDIEYVNFDFQADAYLDIERSFEIQEPVINNVYEQLNKWEINPLGLLSGRGHHIVWKIRTNSAAFRELVKLGHLTQELKTVNHRPHPPSGKPVNDTKASAFSGLGLVMEYLAYTVKKNAAALCSIPLEITAVHVGPIIRGREIVSLDISEYGDPLHTRIIRAPYSIYRKHWVKQMMSNSFLKERIPVLIMVPAKNESYKKSLPIMHDYEKAIEHAMTTQTYIPDQSRGMLRMIREYLQSDIKKYHNWYYSQDHDKPSQWPHTYDRFDISIIPYCIGHILKNPNDLLLMPAGIEQVTRTMLSLGWHPRHIAGLIRSKYERDYNWNGQWTEYDPGSRADFYTRVFTGLFYNKIDDLVDFNCISTQEKRFCFQNSPGCNLHIFKDSLLKRRQYDRLASWPFNRLFL